jgi:multidrug resistance efflux pump
MEYQLLKNQLARLKTLAGDGMIQGREVEPLENKTQEQQGLVDEIGQQLKLRADFLNGLLSASQVEVKQKLSRAKLRMQQAEAKYSLLVDASRRMEARVKDGLVSSRDLGPMQFELKAAEADLRLAKLELGVLQKYSQDQQ